MNGRDASQKYASTRMHEGTDVNFEILTKNLLQTMIDRKEIIFKLSHFVKIIEQTSDKKWALEIKNLKNNQISFEQADFVFIGAGGGSILLLEQAKIKQSSEYGGFPVGGQWLVCTNKKVINNHMAKVYGQAKVNAPPMSVPHLDTRIIDGERKLLFGPFAIFSTKFLKHGSYLDLFKSLQINNLKFMTDAGLKNLNLTKYLLAQASMNKKDKMNELREFLPEAQDEDWIEQDAGQRVQVIKKTKNKGGELQFGTEVVSNDEGSLSALLGASPGASTSVSVMYEVLKNSCFKELLNTKEGQNTLRLMMPSLFINKNNENELIEAKNKANKVLKIN